MEDLTKTIADGDPEPTLGARLGRARGEGQYRHQHVMVWPSVHPEGRPYRFDDDGVEEAVRVPGHDDPTDLAAVCSSEPPTSPRPPGSSALGSLHPALR
jgi:hypothetical protein